MIFIIKATATEEYTFNEDATSSGSMKTAYANKNNTKNKYAIWQWHDMESFERPGYLSPPIEDAKHCRVGKEEKLSIYLASHACIHPLLVGTN
jgi:hypothetical protein